MKTYFLQVKEVIKETEDTITIEFWHPLNEEIKYLPGQFITIAIPENNAKRSYSMSSSPVADTALAVTVKRVFGGLVSNYLNDSVKKGDFLEVVEPMGNFHITTNANATRNIVLIGAGSGITPLISIAKSVLKAENNTKVYLLYGNKNENTIIFKNQLESLANQYPDRIKIEHVLTAPDGNWAGMTGRIDENTVNTVLEKWQINHQSDHFYLCGPSDLMEKIKNNLSLKNVSAENIHSEKFNKSIFEENNSDAENSIAATAQKVQIKYNNKTYDIEVLPHQTVLEAALELDIDLPYSCQAGMCTACMGKCTSGTIKMDEEDGLTDSEIKEGYVLTCVSRPQSANVIIEID